MPKRIVIVDDHPVFREALAEMVKDEADWAVCGQVGDAAQGLEAIRRLRPDLALVDIALPGKSGLQLIKALHAADPAVKVLVVSLLDELFYAQPVLRVGGDGYIMKQEDPEELLRAMRDVLSGRIYLSEQVAASTGKASSRHRRGIRTGPNRPHADRRAEMPAVSSRGGNDLERAPRLLRGVETVNPHRNGIPGKSKAKSVPEPVRSAGVGASGPPL